MSRIKSTQVGAIDYFKPLLERYSRRIIQDETVAKCLVKKVLEDQCKNNELAPSTDLLKILKADLLNHCYYWKQSQIFDKALIKVPLREKILLPK
ncbi:MAG: hypothetical protein KGM16_16885 [Bacteroidota bacterium]|nr:hypothetical protein [Bacteroidota bacterium]